jgi:hypothetical protein
MASANKQQKRAKRAKTKAKQGRIERQNPQSATPIVPDYFMPDFFSTDDEDLDEDTLLEMYIEPEILESMDDEERAAMRSLIRGDTDGLPTEDELLLWEVFDSPAPQPSGEQRIAHFHELKLAEQNGEHVLLLAFARGPVAAHALYDIDFDNYVEILTSTLGAYWIWAHGLDEQAARARIDNEDFFEAFRDALAEIDDAAFLRAYTRASNKPDEPGQD